MSFREILKKAEKPVSAAPFVSFRIVFGLLMVFSTLRFVLSGWIEEHYIKPEFHFHYYGFSWVEPLSSSGLYLVHLFMLFAAIGIATGFAYRISAIVLFITFTYTQLIDLTYYLNHYYFISLICFWLIFIPLPSAGIGTNKSFKLPAWCNWLFIFQLSLVYFFAGVAKINSEWLFEAMPLKIWLPANNDVPFIGNLFNYSATAYVFSWIGMIYDCSIPFLLLYRKTRPFAYIVVIIFHVLTGMLFQIGVFPLVMIGATIIFFSVEWHHRFLAIISRIPLIGKAFKIYDYQDSSNSKPYKTSLALQFLLGFYLLFQILFPFRFLVYPGKLFITEQGYRFSWRVMLVEKSGDATFFVRDAATGREGIVNNREFLNPHQEKQMSYQPDMILEFAHFLGDYYRSRGIKSPEVRAEVYVTINARPGKLLFDPKMDLLKIDDSLRHKSWIWI